MQIGRDLHNFKRWLIGFVFVFVFPQRRKKELWKSGWEIVEAVPRAGNAP